VVALLEVLLDLLELEGELLRDQVVPRPDENLSVGV